MAKQSIYEVRRIIRATRWLRNDFSGMNSEFVKQPVDKLLGEKIEVLKALQIPTRFVEDIERCNEEIIYCRTVIERWKRLQVSYAETK